jgi:hypothetical protein
VSPATFPVAVILVVLACLLVRRVARAIQFGRLVRELGSRGAARRYLLALERERLHALRSLASSSVSPRLRVPAPPLGRSASEGVSADHIGETFPHLMFARRQAD